MDFKVSPKLWLFLMPLCLLFVFLTYLILHKIFPGQEIRYVSEKDIIILGNLVDSDTSMQANLKIYHYLNAHFDKKAEAQLHFLVNTYSPKDLLKILSTYPIKVDGFFWLYGKKNNLEIMFWALFGVISSLLYYGSEAIRKNEFRQNEIAVHIAKIFYTPLCAMVIYFSISLLTVSGDIAIPNFGNELIIISFILGFFSGRTIDLLNKIKELLLPASSKLEDSTNKTAAALSLKKWEMKGIIKFVPDIEDEKDKALLKTEITFQSLNDKNLIIKTTPSKEGIYVMKEIPEGEYNVTASCEHENHSYSFLDTAVLDGNKEMDMSLDLILDDGTAEEVDELHEAKP